MKRKLQILFACALVFSLAAPALAASVHLTNGDRLTGEPAGVVDGKLVLVTENLGEVRLGLDKIASIDSEEAVTVTLASGDRVTGSLATDENGRVLIENDGGSLLAPLAEIKDYMAAADLLAFRDGIDAELEVLGEEEEASPWSGTIEVGFSWFNGNTDRTAVNALLGVVRDTPDDRFEAKFFATYAEEDGNRTTNEQILTLREDLKLDEDWYLFGQLYFERDEFEDLDLRAILSLGAGRILTQSEEGLLKFEIAPTVTYEDYRSSNDGGYAFELMFGLYGEIKVFDEAKLTQTLRFYPNLSDTGEYRLFSLTTFEQPLSESLFLNLSFLYQYNSNAPSGIDKSDSKLLISIAYKF